jgi:hypothetical protein
MHNSVTYPILRRVLGYTNDQQLDHYCHPMTLGIQVRLLIHEHEFVQQCYEVYAYVTHSSTSRLK